MTRRRRRRRRKEEEVWFEPNRPINVRYDRKDEIYDPAAGSLSGQVDQGNCHQ